jgi:hypothetical protein
MVRILQDISLDILPSEEPPAPESPFDYEGVDLLAETVLVGISSWFTVLESTNWALQPWYADFRDAVHLLRRYFCMCYHIFPAHDIILRPLAAALLPDSFSRATSDSLEKDLPTTYREVEFDIMVATSTQLPAPSPVTGLYFSEHIDESGPEASSPHDAASLEETVTSFVPRERMINWDTSFSSSQFRRDFNVVVLGGMFSVSSPTRRLMFSSWWYGEIGSHWYA